MKVAILSDIHSRMHLFTSALDFLHKRGFDTLVVAGDIGSIDVLELIKSMKIKSHIVFGNNDGFLHFLAEEYNIKHEPYYFQIKKTTFKLAHYPFYLEPDADIVIYGHTHMQAVYKGTKTLFLNPGEVCAREKPRVECMELEILDNKYIVRAFNAEPNSNNWEEKIYEYDR